jgi:hypothetical protein
MQRAKIPSNATVPLTFIFFFPIFVDLYQKTFSMNCKLQAELSASWHWSALHLVVDKIKAAKKAPPIYCTFKCIVELFALGWGGGGGGNYRPQTAVVLLMLPTCDMSHFTRALHCASEPDVSTRWHEEI